MKICIAVLTASWVVCSPAEDGARQSAPNPSLAQARTYTTVGRSIGLLRMNSAKYSRRDTVALFNDDGTVWYKFTFYYDDSDGKWDYPNAGFRVRHFDPDHFILLIEVVEDLGRSYRVVVNSATGLEKRIAKEAYLEFVTWEDYVRNAFAITFESRANPIRTTPGAASLVTPPANDRDYFPVQIEGEWLQIKWDPEGPSNRGWIRWREGNRLLVRVYVSA